MFLVFSSDMELTVPPRFALASAMSSSGITTELVTYILAKRSAELDRFGLFYVYFQETLCSNRGVHLTLLICPANYIVMILTDSEGQTKEKI